jgi:hypothetical protein
MIEILHYQQHFIADRIAWRPMPQRLVTGTELIGAKKADAIESAKDSIASAYSLTNHPAAPGCFLTCPPKFPLRILWFAHLVRQEQSPLKRFGPKRRKQHAAGLSRRNATRRKLDRSRRRCVRVVLAEQT